MTDPDFLSGFDRIENDMALRYAIRPCGWPVGREYRGVAWSCVTPTVQIVQQPKDAGPKLPKRTGAKPAKITNTKRYVVVTLFPFLRTDMRYRPSSTMTLHQARVFAWARLRTLAGNRPVTRGQGHGIELARGGDHIGLEVFR